MRAREWTDLGMQTGVGVTSLSMEGLAMKGWIMHSHSENSTSTYSRAVLQTRQLPYEDGVISLKGTSAKEYKLLQSEF